MQEEDGVGQPVQYVSKALTTSQRKWPAITKEAYAIVYALWKLRPYLQGADFTIYTDNKPLQYLFSCEMKNSMLQRFAMQISVRADTLSWIRWPSAECASLETVLMEKSLFSITRSDFSSDQHCT